MGNEECVPINGSSCQQMVKNKWELVLIEDSGHEIKAYEFTYKDHEYILFYRNGGYGHDGFVHNPNCKCNKKE